MRSISNGQLEGFPPADEVKTVFVEADILGELSHYACIDYIFNDPRIQACGSTKDEVAAMMGKVGFSKKMMGDPVTTLSGGWRVSRRLDVLRRLPFVAGTRLHLTRSGVVSLLILGRFAQAHEIGPVARHAPERGHPAHGRAHESFGRDERQVGQGLHQIIDERDVHHGLARLGVAERRLQPHSGNRRLEAVLLQGQLGGLC
jgi:hypothetical protein